MENQNDIFSHSHSQQIFTEHCYIPGPLLLAGEILIHKTDRSAHPPGIYRWGDGYKPRPTYYAQGLRPMIFPGAQENVFLLMYFKTRRKIYEYYDNAL